MNLSSLLINSKKFIIHSYFAILNGRSLISLIFNFLLNFSPVILWLLLFKNASLIPTNLRPNINVKWLPIADNNCFNLLKLTSYLFYIIILIFLILPISFLLNNKNYNNYYYNNNNKLFISLLILSWPLLNLINYLANLNQNFYLDLLSFISYVLLHLIVPILTSIYLYLFQLPGILSCYSWSLGLQNLIGLSTHILLPSSPPWFIHLNGLNSTADYSTLGYAAGLTRIDISLGTHLTTNGFHKSPIVFGALPSLHSAMAVLSCIYINWFTNSLFLSLISIFFVLLQWWSTIYLDHHWRLDLLVGMFYAILSFIILKIFNNNLFVIKNFNKIKNLKDNIDNNNNNLLDFYSDSESDLELHSLNNIENTSSSSLLLLSPSSNLNNDNNQPINLPCGLRIFKGTCIESLFT